MPNTLHTALWFLAGLWTLIHLWQWNRIVQFYASHKGPLAIIPNNTLTLICVFRNEESVLKPFLDSCAALLNKVPITVLLVNDHSTDQSNTLIQDHPIHAHVNFHLYQAPINSVGKKACLQWAIANATEPIIYTTDADCTLNAVALQHLYGLHQQKNSDLTLGLMRFQGFNSLVNSYQLIENNALVALSTYHANRKEPSMGNAANMLFNRSAFMSCKPYQDNWHVTGGDDIFLIQSFLKNHKHVVYANDLKTAISTQNVSTWGELWQQRIRWAKKSQHQEFGQTQKSQLLFVLFLLYLWGLTLFVGLNSLYVIPLSIWSFKIIGEVLFIRKLFSKLPENAPSLMHLVVSSFIQSIFIPAVAIGQFFVSIKWKNRTLS
jgi:cellulose synthase/poly-beta-1,6-N-acetylglucosamine synthase-like glycosyltransferase